MSMFTDTIGGPLTARLQDEARRLIQAALDDNRVNVTGPCARCHCDMTGLDPMWSGELEALVCSYCGRAERTEAA